MPYLIVDCNNFYVSCERAFDARLIGRPVVVLSNNDGCVIARSPEARALGIKMGAPVFQWRSFFQSRGVIALSSNYTLYADMSQRVMETLARFTDDFDIYSIDEAFLYLPFPETCPDERMQRESLRLAREIRRVVQKWTGITVSIGIAATRTLAKVANRYAKSSPEAQGVFCYEATRFPEQLLAATAVEDVWGIGRRRGAALRQHGVATALDLRQASPGWIQRQFTVVGLRTQRELQGISCVTLEAVATKQSILCSRSFGRPVGSREELREAVACFAERAAEKLRAQRSAARVVQVYLRTNRHRSDLPQRSASGSATLDVASSYTPELIAAAHRVAEHLYAPGYSYAKAGVLLCDLCPEGERQLSLFDPASADTPEYQRRQRLMATMDALNKRFGPGKVFLAASGIERGWQGRQARRSPRYTTQWQELFRVA